MPLNKAIRPYTFIDLFAGAGGLSEGFLQAGFKPVAHVEMDENAVKTEDAILLSDKAVQAFINTSLYEITRNKFIANDITYTFLRLAFAEINNYMNNLSKDDIKDGFTVEFGEYLIVSCDEVDGKHVISIEPGKALKTFVKDDKLVAVE